jgi:hypothetical protein
MLKKDYQYLAEQAELHVEVLSFGKKQLAIIAKTQYFLLDKNVI